MVDVFQKVQGEVLSAGVAVFLVNGEITATTNGPSIGKVSVDAAAEDATVLVEIAPA